MHSLMPPTLGTCVRFGPEQLMRPDATMAFQFARATGPTLSASISERCFSVSLKSASASSTGQPVARRVSASASSFPVSVRPFAPAFSRSACTAFWSTAESRHGFFFGPRGWMMPASINFASWCRRSR